MAVSGSRGYLLTLIIALVAASYIMAHHRIETGAVARRRAALSPQAIVLGGAGFAVLAFLTFQRADGAEIGFNVLFRLSEPYWVWAFEYAQMTGGDPNVALFAVERVLSIPMRFLGTSFPFSIEGHEALFEHYFGYIQREGVSLPVTIVGEGLLFGGSGGATFFLALQNGIMMSSIFFWMQRLKANVGMRIAFGALIASKCLGLTARTSTGSLLVLYYTVRQGFVRRHGNHPIPATEPWRSIPGEWAAVTLRRSCPDRLRGWLREPLNKSEDSRLLRSSPW
jgi:hypothetical protein